MIKGWEEGVGRREGGTIAKPVHCPAEIIFFFFPCLACGNLPAFWIITAVLCLISDD